MGHKIFAQAAQSNFEPVAQATGLGSLQLAAAETEHSVPHTRVSVRQSLRAQTGWGQLGSMGRLFLTSVRKYGGHAEFSLMR